MLKLHIVLASTRPTRVGQPVADWFFRRAAAHGAFDAELIDLAAWNLPFMDEPDHPRLGRYVHEHTRRWSAKIDEAEAFVFVTPEYNHGITAPLKNAIDFLHREWHHKAVGLVSYGGVSGGTRASAMLRQVLGAVKAVPIAESVTIPFVAGQLDAERRLPGSETLDQSADAMLHELARVAEALRALREVTAADRLQ